MPQKSAVRFAELVDLKPFLKVDAVARELYGVTELVVDEGAIVKMTEEMGWAQGTRAHDTIVRIVAERAEQAAAR